MTPGTLRAPLGVGVLGCGSVTQAIHLPSLARLTHLFTVAAVMDVDDRTAQQVAGRAKARATTSVDELVGDPDVDVVVVCSPHRFHADQVVAACRAGKRAVLCEKPLATSDDEAAEITRVSAETGVPVVVGAMHGYDPGWQAFTSAWGPTAGSAHHIRCSAVLPPNPLFEDVATEVVGRAESTTRPPTSPEARARRLNASILSLAVHDLPLVRDFLVPGETIVVHSAHALETFGYLVVFSHGTQVVELHAQVGDHVDPRWTFEVFAEDRVGRVHFTPSYVHAGSASATISTPGQELLVRPGPENGYDHEWRHLYDVAHGALPLRSPDEVRADLLFALELSAAATATLLGAPRPVAAR